MNIFTLCIWILPILHLTLCSNSNNGLKSINIGVGCNNSIIYRHIPSQKGPYYTATISNAAAQFISLTFDYFNLPEGDYIEIFAADHLSNKTGLVLNYSSGHLPTTTTPITGKSVTIQLYVTKPLAASKLQSCPGFHISSYYYLGMPSTYGDAVKEAICGTDDTQEIACYRDYPTIYKKSSAVMRLTIAKPEGLFYCTGWLLGAKGHMITNNHCVSLQSHADNMKVEAMAQGNSCSTNCNWGGACEGYVIATSGILVATSVEFDFALIKLITGYNLAASFGYYQLRPSGPIPYEQIYVVQHPSGWGKRIAYKDGSTYGVVKSLSQNTYNCGSNQVSYSLDTAGGSSGSPVIGVNDNAVVALHHCGSPCENSAINANILMNQLIQMHRLPYCSLSTDINCP